MTTLVGLFIAVVTFMVELNSGYIQVETHPQKLNEPTIIVLFIGFDMYIEALLFS